MWTEKVYPLEILLNIIEAAGDIPLTNAKECLSNLSLLCSSFRRDAQMQLFCHKEHKKIITKARMMTLITLLQNDNANRKIEGYITDYTRDFSWISSSTEKFLLNWHNIVCGFDPMPRGQTLTLTGPDERNLPLNLIAEVAPFIRSVEIINFHRLSVEVLMLFQQPLKVYLQFRNSSLCKSKVDFDRELYAVIVLHDCDIGVIHPLVQSGVVNLRGDKLYIRYQSRWGYLKSKFLQLRGLFPGISREMRDFYSALHGNIKIFNMIIDELRQERRTRLVNGR